MRKWVLGWVVALVCVFCAAGMPAQAVQPAVSVNVPASTVLGGADGPTAVFVSESSPDDDATPTPAPTAAPVHNPDISLEVTLGYDGLLVFSRWMPSVATVTNHGPDFEGMLGVNVFVSQEEYDRYEIPLTLASGATKQVSLPIRPMINQDMYAFELVDGEGLVVAETRVSPARVATPSSVYVGLLSDTPAALGYFTQRASSTDTLRGETWTTVALDAETFPDSDSLLSTFQVLVVDGVDVRTLRDEQQEALRAWLLEGGIVIVSGGAKAAAGWPFFSQWTGLEAGVPTEQPDITPALLAYAGLREDSADSDIWLSSLPAQSALIASGTQGILRLDSAGNGLIFTAAFDLSGKPITAWRPVASLWPHIVRQSIPDVYAQLADKASGNYYDNTYYQADSLMYGMAVEQTPRGLVVLGVLCAFLLLAGFGAYLVLRRFDRREWMWVAVPVLAMVFVGVLMLLGDRIGMSTPIALTTTRVTLDDTGTQTQTFLGVASGEQDALTVSTGQDDGSLQWLSPDYYYDDGSLADSLFRPLSRRVCYRFGETPDVTLSRNEPWQAQYFTLTNATPFEGDLEVRLWMEADGMHGEAVNNTPYLLEDCVLVTGFGYCAAGDLLPGQRAELALLDTGESFDYSSEDFSFTSGLLYSPASFSAGSSSYNPMVFGYGESLSSFLHAAFQQSSDDSARWQQSLQQALALQYNDSQTWDFYNSRALYLFFAFSDQFGRFDVSINGEPAERTAHYAVLGTQATFEPIGPEGDVFFPQQVIPCEVVEYLGPDEKPRPAEDEEATFESRYISLQETMAVRFVLPEYGRYDISIMSLSAYTYDSMPTLSLYNNDTQAWDEQPLLNVAWEGSDWAPYIDAEGAIYLRLEPSEGASQYDGMYVPVISLKGQVKDDA